MKGNRSVEANFKITETSDTVVVTRQQGSMQVSSVFPKSWSREKLEEIRLLAAEMVLRRLED